MHLNPKYCTVTMITQRDFALTRQITCQASLETLRRCAALAPGGRELQ